MKFWKKIKNWMPIFSALFVVVCIGISLNGYVAPVYAVEVPETAAQKAVEETEEQETEAPKGNFDLADGVYEGSGTGFNGTVKVAVEIKDGAITAIEVLSSNDDAAFFNRAKGVIEAIIAGQTLEVDVVSGATYSSRGIINAVKNALTGEVDSNEPAASGSDSDGSDDGSTSVDRVEEADAYKDGTYYGSGEGFAGTIKVKVVVKDGKIDSIRIVSTSDGSSYIDKASAVISKIIKKQSTNVDTVSGATYSSVGIINAVRDALKDAAVSGEEDDPEDNKKPDDPEDDKKPVTGTIPYKDGIYYGVGEGYLDDIKVAVVIQDKTIKAILVTEQADDAAFFARAEKLIDTVIEKQSTDVDVVSGATYSSKGILEAINEALKAADEATNGKKPDVDETETDKPEESDVPETDETDTPETDETDESDVPETGETDESDIPETEETEMPEIPQTVYIDGDYRVSVTCSPDEDEDFAAYTLSAKVTIKNDKITAISDIAGDGDAGNASYIKRAASGTSKIKGVVAQIIEKGLPEEIDVVSRATCSSNSIADACRKALEQAKRPTD